MPSSDHSYFLISNFGDESLALIQWAFENSSQKKILKNLKIISIDTGWAAPSWEFRIKNTDLWLQSLGIEHIRLQPSADFKTLMETQGKFPSRQFQWCANFLKALPMLDYLDSVDPNSSAIILLARRRTASRLNFDLPEFVQEEPKWGDRKIWHPLYLYSQEERNFLIQKTPLPILNHRSLECDPCVNTDASDLLRVDLSSIQRTADLERKLQAQFLDPGLYNSMDEDEDKNKDKKSNIFKTLDLAKADLEKSLSLGHLKLPASSELFDMGCGNTFGCGL